MSRHPSIHSQQGRMQSYPKQMTPQEYMIHKNIPFTNPAKKISIDKDPSYYILPQGCQKSEQSTSEVSRLQSLLEEKCKEVEMLKATEMQSKHFTSQFQDLTQSHQQELTSLQMQVQNYKQRNQDLKSQVEQYLVEINRNNQQYQDILQEKDEYEKKYDMINRNYENLMEQLESKDLEIEELRDRICQIENENQVQMNQYAQHCEQQKRSFIDQQIKEMSMKYNQERQQSEVQLMTGNHQIIELENKCALLSSENERLQYKMRNEIENLNLEIQQIQESNQSELQSYNEQLIQERMRIIVQASEIERLWKIIQETDSMNKRRSIEMEDKLQLANTLEININQLKQQLNNEQLKQQQFQNILNQKDEQVAMLTTELERLNQLLSDYEQELDNKVNDYNQLLKQQDYVVNNQQEQLKCELMQKDDQIVLLTQECERLRRQMEDRIRDSDHFNNLYQNSSEIIQKQKNDIKYLSDQNTQTKQKQQELCHQLNQKINELQRLNEIVNQLQQENDIIQGDLQNTKRDNELLHLQCRECEEQIQILNESIELQKNKHQVELLEFRKQNEFQKRSFLDQQIRELTQKYNQDKESLEAQNRTLSVFKQQLEGKVYFYESEIEKMSNLLHESQQDKEQFKDHLIQMESERQRERMRIVVLCAEIERLESNDNVDKLKMELFHSREKETQLMNEINEMYQQIEQLQIELNQTQKNNLDQSDLETRFQAERISWESQKYYLQQNLQDKDQKIQMLNQEIIRWSSTAEERMKEIENWKNKVYNSSLNSNVESNRQEQQYLESVIQDLESENFKLKSSAQSLDQQLALLQSQMQEKQREIEEMYAIMNKQRRQSEYSNKEVEMQRKQQFNLTSQIQQLDSQIMHLQEQLQLLQNQNEDLQQLNRQQENALLERDSMLQRKTLELNERIKEFDLLKDKYQNRMRNSSRVQQQENIHRQKMSSVPMRQQDQFRAVLNSPLNNSKSKVQYSFPKSPRFKKLRPYCETAYYNCTFNKSTRSTSFGFGNRYDFTKTNCFSSTYYDLESSFSLSKGKSFGLSRNAAKASYYITPNSNPGPGQYFESTITASKKYSLRDRTKTPWMPNFLQSNVDHRNESPGPGQYKVTNQKQRSCTLYSQAKRFKTEEEYHPGPGDYSPQKLKGQQLCKFGSAKRTCFIDKVIAQQERNQYPGPGNYQMLTQFANVKSRPSTAKY